MKHIKVILDEVVKILLIQKESNNINLKEGEFDQWMLRNRQSGKDDLMPEASRYSINQKREN
jgi:hypothetical protein